MNPLPLYEKLGSFYLGRVFDSQTNKTTEETLLYDSRNLVTHAICVGMTGSGKTGLGLGLVEEAAIDGIPTIVIDPKGDLANLLLTFPDLNTHDFEPWVNPADAEKAGLDLITYAGKEAAKWRQGLQDWGQDADRIRRLKDAADFVVYTPGSSAGKQVSILKSFSPPPVEILDDEEAFAERIFATTSGLLALANVKADATSREFLLLSNIFADAWRGNKTLDLPSLIETIQRPGFSRIGALELESFYPAKDRFELSVSLNNLLASPAFKKWMAGEPLVISDLLWTPTAKPRVCIFSIAHLNDEARMFFVTLLLSEIIGWMRQQRGSGSLRALVYMDEITGYIPPNGNPPSKPLLLTLLKQARAFGLGMVLSSQNPVDLDYKALSNAGTWFIGRLQTERDKERLMDGLESASPGGLNRAEIGKWLSALRKRVFLLHNISSDTPVLFETRWTMSYLAGPMTRHQIKALNPIDAIDQSQSTESINGVDLSSDDTRVSHQTAPSLPADVPVYFFPWRGSGNPKNYVPFLFCSGRVVFEDQKPRDTCDQKVHSLFPFFLNSPIAVNWDMGTVTDVPAEDLEREARPGVPFTDLPPDAARGKNYKGWSRDYLNWVYRTQTCVILTCSNPQAKAALNQTQKDFTLTLEQLKREERDAETKKLKDRYSVKVAGVQQKLERARDQISKEEKQAQSQKMQTMVSVGTSILSAFLGRKVVNLGNISRVGTAARQVGKSYKESEDVTHAKDKLLALEEELQLLDRSLESEINLLIEKYSTLPIIEKTEMRPTKSNITVNLACLVWVGQ
ncbi:MAG: ATP-binding protein [Verrucomicrobiota bacterium]|nr:ATP-binding protein [Verrucomicrobiota bacterium]